ncbi:hypothetical protein INT46_006438 [Mucor plumbeus]|uniref:ABC transporter domain-containing protein n=1 Tax=Mucor plumbeus TaxID=97098 RepID=A0A8H7QY46_9FUNG|nr:hypothetical protein INT46_006438 [Mucor plumbeus]
MKNYPNSLFPHFNKRQKQECPECPVCFNCQLPTNTCANGGICDPSGACVCPIGWGDLDCAQPLCGSLYEDDRTQRKQGEDCACDTGWGGVNCNVCQEDKSCQPFKGLNATCIKSAIGLKSLHAWCATTNIPWIDNTHVSLSCEWEKSECVFQFWKDSEEQFYCELSECTQTTSGDTDVQGYCAKANCGCMKDAFMCGKEVDMSELVKNVKGPSEWFCKNGKDCWYNEYSTLVSVFPDNIQLACDAGECANEQDFMDAVPIDQEFSSYTEMMIIGAIFVACILLFAITKFTASRQKKMFGTRIELEDDEDNESILNYSSSAEIALTFSDVSYTVSRKSILSNISGYVEPGKMLAVMGPSGAGKSSLLDILSRKHKRGVISGKILINGILPTRRQFKRMTGFVDQDDSLMGTLTVRETLTYAALMRLPRKIPLKVKQKRVEDVIQELGLSKIADSKIGMPGQRGISGGEKRRVSIGKELVTSPSLLFLDEPTSGLDAYNAGVVMECLQNLAHEGNRTIVVTIHQPRSNIFKMFDSLMLLASGQLVYFGPAKTCSNYFKNLGFTIPIDYNVADYLIDLTMKRPDDTITRSNTPIPSSRSQMDVDVEPLEEIHTPYSLGNGSQQQEGSGEVNLLADSNHAHFLVDSFYSSDLYQIIENRIGRATANTGDYSVWVDAPGQEQSAFSIHQFYHELTLLSSRTFINLYRNPFLFFAHFAFSIVLAILLGSLFWQVDVDLSGVQNRLGVLFFMCALLGFAATSALDMFNKERILFMRERENGYYSPSAYFVAKVLFDIVPLRVLPPLVMGSISYYMIGLNSALPIFGKFLLVLVLFNLAAAGLCLCFATAFKNLSAANLLANLVILFSMLFGGFLLNKDHIPPIWLQHLSFFNYGYEALIVNELKDITLRDKSIADIQIPGPIILARFGFNGQAFWSDVSKLIAFVFITLITSFLFLKYLVKERR